RHWKESRSSAPHAGEGRDRFRRRFWSDARYWIYRPRHGGALSLRDHGGGGSKVGVRSSEAGHGMITMRLSFDLIVALATMVLISALLAWASVRVAIRRPKWQSSLLALFAVVVLI